ncbi:MAG TPA: alcohol dehydrogenase catalytic domain-containing protein [Anaerolineae bacterium]|nr:alcohol dehydrogenase catalytic domain-containing protein [Anaerolineae bacterium]
MKQAVVTEPGRIAYREVPRPVAQPGQVLLRIVRIGICGSDVHVFEGKHPLVSFPLVQGHEFSATVEEVGDRVEGLRRGDLVTVQPAIGCGRCGRCAAGLVAQCDKLLFVGGALPGASSEFLAMEASQVIKMPPGVDADDAAMVEPLAVAVHAVGRPDGIAGKRLLIVGAGTIGNLTAQVARGRGAGPAVIVDKIPFRNSLAEGLGFQTLDPALVDSVEEAVQQTLGGERPEVAFECVGKAVPLNTCIRSVGRGGDVVVVGVYEDDPRTQMILVQDKEITLKGSLMYTWDDYYTAVDLIARRQVELKPLQTHHFPFEAWGEAYRLLMSRPDEAVKVLIDMV